MPMDTRAVPALALILFSLIFAGWLGETEEAMTGPSGAAAPDWRLEHVASDVAAEGYNERWLLVDAPENLPPAMAFTFEVEGDEIPIAWDRQPGPCASFSALMSERDYLVPYVLRVDGERVLAGMYGAGAGTPMATGCD